MTTTRMIDAIFARPVMLVAGVLAILAIIATLSRHGVIGKAGVGIAFGAMTAIVGVVAIVLSLDVVRLKGRATRPFAMTALGASVGLAGMGVAVVVRSLPMA